jgi:hypothetical protein
MEPRPPDSVYSMRLIEEDMYNSFDEYHSLTNEELVQLEKIELAQIEELEIQELEELQFKEIEQNDNIFKQTVLQSKKDMFVDIIQKLNLTKTRLQEPQEKFIKLENKINKYLESIDPTETIDTELDQFIDWLCDKTTFSRYKYKDLLKKIFIKPI